MNLHYDDIGCLYSDGVLIKENYIMNDLDIMKHVKKTNIILYKYCDKKNVRCLFMRNNSLIEKYQNCLLKITDAITEFCVCSGFHAFMFSFNEFFEHSVKIKHYGCNMNMCTIAHLIFLKYDSPYVCYDLLAYLKSKKFEVHYILAPSYIDKNAGVFYFKMDDFLFRLKYVCRDYANLYIEYLYTSNGKEFMSLYWKYLKPSLKVKHVPWHREIVRNFYYSKRTYIDYNDTLLALSMEQNKCSLAARSFFHRMYRNKIKITGILDSIINKYTLEKYCTEYYD